MSTFVECATETFALFAQPRVDAVVESHVPIERQGGPLIAGAIVPSLHSYLSYSTMAVLTSHTWWHVFLIMYCCHSVGLITTRLSLTYVLNKLHCSSVSDDPAHFFFSLLFHRTRIDLPTYPMEGRSKSQAFGIH